MSVSFYFTPGDPMSVRTHIAIREATPADVDAMVAVLITTKSRSLPALTTAHDLKVQFWTARWHGYLTEGSSAQHSRGDGSALVAEVDGRIVGFAAYHHTTRHSCDAELESLYVLPEAQGHGLGTVLLAAVVARLQADGSASLCVGYDPRNPYRRFYWRAGAVELNPHWAIWRELPTLAAPGTS